MSNPFQFSVTIDSVELRISSGTGGFLPVDLWAIDAPEAALAGVDVVQRLVAANSAITADEVVLIEHSAVAALSLREADRLGLPILADVVAEVNFEGLITSPAFRVRISWMRPNGQNIVGVERTGAFLRFGGAWRRLPDALFAVAEAIDKVDASGGEVADRLTAIASLREALPVAQADGIANPHGLVGSLTIAVADSFSLDLKEEGGDAKLVPILHRTGSDSSMLEPAQQSAFADDQFNRFSTARPVYTLSGNTYVVLAPPLRRALEVVRSAQSSPLAIKRALIRSPRTFLRDALGDDVEDTVIEGLFRETAEYSDRVVGLGLWEPRVVPWVPLPSTNWLGGEVTGVSVTGSDRRSERGLVIGDRCVTLDEAAVSDLRARVESAMGSGLSHIPLDVDGETISVPATHETLGAIHLLEASQLPRAEKAASAPAREALIIHPNEETVGVEALFQPRPGPPIEIPACVIARLKPHQNDGVKWLQRAWLAGAPGVLLADDMGLGKTLQGLTFLAWLRDGMRDGRIERGPLLIVAPTGLLENWMKEHGAHLAAPGLGTCLRAYGRGLAELRRIDVNGAPALDLEALSRADWVLTTYETLRDYDRDFGLVPFIAMLCDEAQKIKNPGVRITDAAKGMKADFRIAMTGTPVENRLSDLWCIVDGVHPGFLDDLKAFSSRYEASHNAEALMGLKRDLERPLGGRPPLLLRRMKYDHLPDLPPHEEFRHETRMPPPQADAYKTALDAARGADRRGAVLEALQRLRAISLHPDGTSEADDDHFISASAIQQLHPPVS